MAVILAISSQVAHGRVGLSAYQFALQKLGHEVICLPTVYHVTHAALGKPVGLEFSGDKMADMAAELISQRHEERIDYILSGYFFNVDQAKSVKWIITQLKSKNPNIQYCCDPVMGDHPKGQYVVEDVAQYIKTYLAPMADLLTPNIFEAEYLGELRNKKILHKTNGENIYIENGEEISQAYKPVDIHINGAGDLFTALFIGYQLNGDTAQTALKKATDFLHKCATFMAENNCVQLPVVEMQDYL